MDKGAFGICDPQGQIATDYELANTHHIIGCHCARVLYKKSMILENWTQPWALLWRLCDSTVLEDFARWAASEPAGERQEDCGRSPHERHG